MKKLTRSFFRLSLVLALGTAATLFAAVDRNYKTTPVMRLEVRKLVQMLEYYHYNKEAVSSADYPQLVTDYMAELDPQRLFFTAQDEQTLRKQFGPRIETDLSYLGNIDTAFDIFRLYEQRVESRANWIFDALKKDYDFTAKEAYALDRSKSPWPADSAAADDLWRRRVKFELVQDLVNDKSLADAKTTVRKRYERMLKNVGEIEASDIQEMYLSSLTRMYDPHSAYFSADSLEDFSIQMKLSLVGIGAILSTEDDGNCVVREIVPGGPADLSGQIKVNDKIIAVKQAGAEPVEVIGMKLRRIVDMVRGQKDTKVVLTIQPHDSADTSKSKQVTLTRDLIKINSSRAQAAIYEVPAANGQISPVGVITLNSFYGPTEDSTQGDLKSTCSKDVAELIGKLKQQGIAALVIDLRRNGGGLLSEAVELTGLFIGKGPVVQVKDSLGRTTVDSETNPAVAYDGPLAVLTSRFSASASEIFAGALQNYGRAIIIGDSSTHGKGTVQQIFEMKNYLPRLAQDPGKTGAAKLTIQKFYLPNGESTQNRGVIPDIALPSIDDYLPIGESSLPHALVWDEIKSTPFTGKPLAKAFVQPLLQASQDRQTSLDEFIYLKKNIEHFKERQEQKLVSLNLADRLAQKKADAEFKKLMDADRDRLAKNNFAHHDVKLDSVLASEALAKKPAPPVVEDGDTDAVDSDALAKLDIYLRESLRVVTDALKLTKDPQYWADGHAPLTVADSRKG
ncbi:MAG: carboxy terminal-processing peptidase [Opitutae bacterium]|nr:carboxy terminal-processing peptidase [Opitutae bacterium]